MRPKESHSYSRRLPACYICGYTKRVTASPAECPPGHICGYIKRYAVTPADCRRVICFSNCRTGSHSPCIHRTEPTEIFLALTQTCVLFITRHFSDTPNRKFIGLSRVFHRPMIYLSHNRVSPSFAQPLESYDRAYDRLAINSRAGALPDQSGTVSECPC